MLSAFVTVATSVVGTRCLRAFEVMRKPSGKWELLLWLQRIMHFNS